MSIHKLGIIICDRYRRCAGGKCFSSFQKRQGAFSRYLHQQAEIVGYTSCDGCPGGNIEYAAEEMIKNGATVIHFATGLIVGYPPCPSLEYFKDFLTHRYSIDVVYGTHPIPQKYYDMHKQLQTWAEPKWSDILRDTLSDEPTRLAYN